jgi:hypothetical protein
MREVAASLSVPVPRRCRRDFVTDVDDATEANLKGASR